MISRRLGTIWRFDALWERMSKCWRFDRREDGRPDRPRLAMDR
jgi:hypothetical protein